MDDRLRLVVWNCAGAFRKKYSALLQLCPDIAIIPEASEDFAQAIPDNPCSALWDGDKGKTGVGVVAFNGWSLELADMNLKHRFYLPCIATRGTARLHVVAVCAKKSQNYVTPTLNALHDLSDFLAAAPSIFAGDLNGSVRFDSTRPTAFQGVIDVLSNLDLSSAWHAFHRERFGEESKPTFYMYRRVERSFHIDYAFLPKALNVEDVQIGEHEDWFKLSDHAPLSVDVRLAQFASWRS